jgi:stearoyl-CoA desaturase (delta-9 desaturase)
MRGRAVDILARRQRIHAWAILLVPSAGTLVAVVLAARYGVRTLELALLVAMYSLTMLGIIVGFHRHASHHAFDAHPAVRVILLASGSMAAQGPLFYWVANHRRHHQLSDRPGDPHSPRFDEERPLSGVRGLLHAHMGWSFDHPITNVLTYGKDLFRDPILGKINRLYYPLVALGLLLPGVVAGLVSGSFSAVVTGVLWGGLVRLFLVHHVVFAVNSLGHAFGARPFATRDESRNNAWLAIPSFGDAWHNNHHAFPSAAYAGLEPWQIDVGGWVISALEWLGLARAVKRPTRAAMDTKRRTTTSVLESLDGPNSHGV